MPNQISSNPGEEISYSVSSSELKHNYQDLIDRHLQILKGLQYESGLFAASKKEVATGYDKSWLRDNFYECLAFEVIGDWETVEKTYDALLSIFLKHEEKIDWAISKKPEYRHQFIHARYHPETFEEFWEEWGNKQNDTIGAILYRVGKLEKWKKGSIIESEDHLRIIGKLIKYLESIEYWHDRDSGMWEENEEIHSSSVGACIAGLQSISKLENIEIPEGLIEKGRDSLNALLPRESEGKFVDLAQLSLIYPYNIVNDEQRDIILTNLEYHLLRNNGVIRYKNDYYYNNNPDGHSEEAEWVFGFCWLAIIYEKMGNKEKAKYFLDKAIRADTPEGLPELYFSNSDKYNENTPLGWTESLFIIALHNLLEKN